MKKRLIPILLVLCICMTLIPMKAAAATSGSCGTGVYFSFNESTGLLQIYGNGAMNDYRYSYGYSDAPWKDYVATIKKIEVGYGVTRIGNTAFNGCWNAETITIPETVSSIGSKAFYGCTALTSITIPSKVTAIESYTFYRTGITEIDLPDGITTLGDGAFADSALTSIDIPAGVTTISTELFYSCDNLEKVTIRGDITDIGSYAFYSTAINELNFEGTLSGTIGEKAFAYCENLPSFHVPGTVTRIEAYAFCGCEGMTELTLEEGITSIGDSAFRETGISTLTIPSTVSYFGGRIADFSHNLKNVTMYTPTVEICKTWILNMRDLDYVHIIGDAPKTTVEVFSSTSQATDFVVYYDKGTSGWEGDTWNGYKIKPWNTTEPVASGTWGDNITWELTDDGTLTLSGEGQVDENRYEPYPWKEYADQIISVVLEEGITNVPVSAFNQCFALTSVTLPDTLTEIGNSAFGETGLTTIDIPVGVTRIGITAFSSSKLTEIVLPEGLLELGHGVFYGCEDLKSAYLPDSLEKIGMNLFSNCTALETANIPKNLEYVPDAMFNGCPSLKEIEIPEGIEGMYMSNFSNSGLVSVTIPSSMKTMISAFGYCMDLEEIIFLGDAPEMNGGCFRDVTATAFYPAGNATWTADVMQDYGGTITWIPYGDVEKEYTAKFTSISTSLGGNIAMNFYAELSADLLADSDAFIRFTFAGQTLEVPVSQGVLNENGTYRFSCPITSKNMTDDITAQFFCTEGAVGDAKSMAVDTYCNWVINNYTDTKTINLMKAMLNYGASAQLLFSYRTDDLANAALSEADKTFGQVDASAFAHSVTGTEEGIKPTSCTLMLDSETAIRVYFQLTGDKTIDQYTFKVDGVEVTPVYKDGKYYIEKSDIGAHRLDEMHTFTCGDLTITYGGLSYVNQVMKAYTSGTTFNMASALYAYSKAAEEYIG